MVKNIKLILEFDGTSFHGWQAQKGTGRRTIQEQLETAISRITQEKVKTVSSGRTDAGVHACGLVVNFTSSHSMPSNAWTPALNCELPGDIRVLNSEEVPKEFHARFSASGKIYRYLVFNANVPTALFRNRAWHIGKPLRLGVIRTAAKHLVGKHDFSAFRAAQCNAASPIRTLRKLDIRKRAVFIEFTLEADGFLMHMARNIVGTLVETGLGRFTPEEVKVMLRSRERSAAGRTAPPQGLYLMHVNYATAHMTKIRKNVTEKALFSFLQKTTTPCSLKKQ